jgi:hypothetical protein
MVRTNFARLEFSWSKRSLTGDSVPPIGHTHSAQPLVSSFRDPGVRAAGRTM